MMMGKGANSHKYGNKASVVPTFQRTNKVGEKSFFPAFSFFQIYFQFFSNLFLNDKVYFKTPKLPHPCFSVPEKDSCFHSRGSSCYGG